MDISTASTCLLSRLCALQGRAQHDPLLRAPAAPTRSPGSPRCASHQAVPAHGVQSGEAIYNYLVQIADGHFISAHAEPPVAKRGVAFVPSWGCLIVAHPS